MRGIGHWTRAITVLAVSACVAGVVACGSDDDGGGNATAGAGATDQGQAVSDEQAVKAAVREMQDGLYAGSGARVCGSLTQNARKKTATASGGKQSCEQRMEPLAEAFKESRAKGETIRPKVVKVSVKGNRGNAKMQEGHGQPYLVPVVREGGDWKLNLPLAVKLQAADSTSSN